jgi:hypothetical protein
LDVAGDQVPRKTVGADFKLDCRSDDEVLDFLWQTILDLRACNNLPHPVHAKVLFTCAKQLILVKCHCGLKVTTKKPNDMVEFLHNGETAYGQIGDIFQVMGHTQSVVLKILWAKEVAHED